MILLIVNRLGAPLRPHLIIVDRIYDSENLYDDHIPHGWS
jgi:hypothetical protein